MPPAIHPAVTRVRALQAQRWPLTWIAAQLGYDAEIPFLHTDDVAPQTDQRVTALFDRIGDRKGPCEESAAEARSLGFWPAIHYDENMRLLRSSIPGLSYIGDGDRYRRYLVIAALSARDYDHVDICKVLDQDPVDSAFEKVCWRVRREIGFRMRVTREIFEWSRLLAEQAPLRQAIRHHTRGIAVRELVDELDDEGLDYRKLWYALCDTADLLMGAGAAGLPAIEAFADDATLTAAAA